MLRHVRLRATGASIALVLLMVGLVGCGMIGRSDEPVPVDDPLTFHQVEAVSAAPCEGRSGQVVLPDSADPQSCLTLASAALTVDRLAEVTAERPEGQAGWAVMMILQPEDAVVVGQLTTAAAAASDPQNRIAIVMAGTVLVAPTVSDPILGGSVMISGSFTERQAKDLATSLGGR